MQDHAEKRAGTQGELCTKQYRSVDVRRPAESPRPAAGAAAAAGGRRLESIDYKLKSKSEVLVVNHRCKARTCPRCGRVRGWETRQVLLEKARDGAFQSPYLLTLTVDPKGFDSPEAAHDAVTSGSYIPRLLRLFNIRVWVWVLEFQQNGWPHWHILVDLAERGRLSRGDLRRMWYLWRDKWGLGGLDVQERKRFGTAQHAVMYVTKYLTKPPRRGYPAWFIRGKRRRMIQASRAVGALCFRGSGEKEEAEEEAEEDKAKSRSDSRPLVDRMAECGCSSQLLLRKVDERTGEERHEIVGELPVSVDKLQELERSGELPRHFGMQVREVLFFGGRYEEVTFCSVDQAERVARMLGAMGYGEEREERIQKHRVALLSGEAWKSRKKSLDGPSSGRKNRLDSYLFMA